MDVCTGFLLVNVIKPEQHWTCLGILIFFTGRNVSLVLLQHGHVSDFLFTRWESDHLWILFLFKKKILWSHRSEKRSRPQYFLFKCRKQFLIIKDKYLYFGGWKKLPALNSTYGGCRAGVYTTVLNSSCKRTTLKLWQLL